MYNRYYIPRNSINKKIYPSYYTTYRLYSIVCPNWRLVRNRQIKDSSSHEILSSSATHTLLSSSSFHPVFFSRYPVSVASLQHDHTVLFYICIGHEISISFLINKFVVILFLEQLFPLREKCLTLQHWILSIHVQYVDNQINDNQTLNSLFFNENLLSLLQLNTSIHSFAKKKKKSATFDEFKTDHLLRSRKKSKRLKGDVSSGLK